MLFSFVQELGEAMVTLVLTLLLAGGQPEQLSDVLDLGPSRRIEGLIEPSQLPQQVSSSTPLRRASRVPRIVLTLGGFAGEGPPYESYPLPPPSGRSRGTEGELAINIGRVYVTADVQQRLGGRGWSADAGAQLRIASLRSVSVSIIGQSISGMSGDLLYQGPTDVGLGMRVTSSVFLTGTTFRLGDVDYPTIEVAFLGGASRFEQAPELWIGGSPFDARDPLTQITRNPVYAARVRSSFDVTGRLVVTGAVTYMGWIGETSSLLPRDTIGIQGGVRFGVWRWCSLSVKARWARDNRGTVLNRSALTLGLTIQKK